MMTVFICCLAFNAWIGNGFFIASCADLEGRRLTGGELWTIILVTWPIVLGRYFYEKVRG